MTGGPPMPLRLLIYRAQPGAVRYYAAPMYGDATMDDTESDTRPSKRRRAIIACGYCRKRKRRCDGKQPRCSLCEQSNRSTCDYGADIIPQVDGQANSDAAQTRPDLTLTSRVSRLEAAIEKHIASIDVTYGQLQNLINTRNAQNAHSIDNDNFEVYTPATTLNQANQSPEISLPLHAQESIPMVIPLGHGSTSEDLIQTKRVKLLIGDHPRDMLLKTEQNRELPSELTFPLDTWTDAPWQFIERETAVDLITVYFSEVNPRFPILDQGVFKAIFDCIDLERTMNLDLALVLMLLAVASVSRESPDNIVNDSVHATSFAAPAIQFLLRQWPLFCATNTRLSQGLFLAGTWYNYLCRPLQAWRMFHMASTNIQHTFLVSDNQAGNPSSDLMRLCWAIFLAECDILAEYHLPRSGIENVIEKCSYPESGPQSLDEHLLSWLGNLSARRLMNRVHFTMYNKSAIHDQDSSESILDGILDSSRWNILHATSAELNHQLNMWWDLLPPSTKPDLNRSDSMATHADLTLRYWACSDIIHRPFLFKICSMPQGLVPEDPLVERALNCIQPCRQFLHLAFLVTKVASPFTMINLHSTLAAFINIAVASLCPYLSEHVSDIEELESMAISTLKRWASKGSSIELILKVAVGLRDKRQMMSSFG